MAGPPRLMSLFLLLAARCVSPLAAPRGHAQISRPAAILSTIVTLATRSRAARVPSVGHTSALALALRTTQTRAAPHLSTAVALATVLPVGADDAAALPLVERFADLVTYGDEGDGSCPGDSFDDAALAVAREFVLGGGGGDDESCSGDYEDYGDVDAFGAFRAAAAAAAGVEKATALAIVLLVIEHGAAPFDDPEVVALCRALAPEARESLVSSLEEYFGDFYETAAVELGALRYALLSTEERRAAVAEMAAARPYGEALPEEATMLLERLGAGGLFEADDDSVELWIDVVFFLLVFGVLCALSAALRRACSLANRSRRPQADRQADDAVARLLAEDDRERKARLKRTGRTPRGRSPRAKPNGSSVPTTTRSPSPSATASDASSSEAEMPDLPLRGGKPSRPAARPKSARDASGSKRGGPLKPKKVPKEVPKATEEKKPSRRARAREKSAQKAAAAAAAAATQPPPPPVAPAPQPVQPPITPHVAPPASVWASPDPPPPPPQRQPFQPPGFDSSYSSPEASRLPSLPVVAPHPPPSLVTAAARVKVMPVPPNCGDDLLAEAFARYGSSVVGARVVFDRVAPYGYVDFATRSAAVAAAFQTHGAELFSGGGSVSCIVVSNTATRDRAGSLDGGVRLNPLEAREVQSNALASDLRADAPTFGAYDPMESLARGFA
ncbi:unnamed protein product [Pelagomonas calceolata]|uniref:RRM domain-containing protein n=2 Tax=Pelagomonas calceolata TaxID=35677 RepID=A0A8J2SGP6_9STRA|nr:unnamed protein product [Pelagomonas calceolata]